VSNILIYLIAAGLLFQPAGHGEDGLTLEQAVRMALDQNPEILMAQKEVALAMGKRLQMEALSGPDIVFRDEGLSLKKKTSENEGQEYSFGIEQGFEFPGKKALRGEIGRRGEEQSALELEKIRRLVIARVKKSYYKNVLSRRKRESLDKAAALLDEFIENLVINYQAGTASYSDVLRAKVEKARLRNQIIEEQTDGVASRAELNLLLGRRGDEAVNLLTDMVYAPLDKGASVFKEEARASSPTLKLLSSKRRQSEAGLRLAQMNKLPDFSLGLYFPSLRMGSFGFSVGLNVPIWRTKRQGEIMEAEASNDIALLSAEKEERRLMARIESAYAGAKTAGEQVKIFEESLLKDMEDEIKLGISRYQYGKIEFFNLLDLYRTYAAARLEHLKSLYLYLVSLADLEVAGEEYAD